MKNKYMRRRWLPLLVTIGTVYGCGHSPTTSRMALMTYPIRQKARSVPVKALSNNRTLDTFLLQATNRQPHQLILKRKPGIQMSSHAFQAFHKRYGVQVSRKVQQLDVEVINVPAGVNYASFLQKVQSDPTVAYVEPNRIRHISLAVNDPRLNEQYALEKTDAFKAWDITTGNEEVVVAVIDTGVDINHPELKDRIVPGFSAISDHPSPADDNGHGTHVAGIVAASANNGIGVAGIAPHARIMPIKVLSGEGFGDDAGIAEGIIWATNHGADIINMSLGGAGSSRTLEDAVNYALRKNVAVVAAMGNDGGEVQNYPAAQPGVIAVGSTDQQDLRSDFSNMGNWISVSAPGSSILSTFPTYTVALNDWGYPQNYAVLDGTSMASPYVSGLVALMKSREKPLNPHQVLSRLKKGVVDLGSPGFDIEFGFGRINALKTLSD